MAMEVQELRPGLWRWVLPHPEWEPGGGWEELVASYSLTAADGVVLFDPLAPEPGSLDAERFWSALDRDVERAGAPPAVLLTVFWHARSTREVLERYAGATLWAHQLGAEEIGKRTTPTDVFGTGDELPGGAVAYEVPRRGEVLFWLPEHRGLVAGDVLLGTQAGGVRLCPPSWLPDSVELDDVRASLRPLLDLPVELLLLTHGEPVGAGAREVLAAAIAPENG